MRRRLTGSPTVTLLAVFLAVFAVQQLVGVFATPLTARSLFALSTPVAVNPWTVVTSVYAHGSVSHLLANGVALLFVGALLERETTTVRFHAFFLVTGALAGIAEVWFAAVFGGVLGAVSVIPVLGALVPTIPPQVNVLGASGAIFALVGYLLASNRVADRVVGDFAVSGRVQLALLALLAAAITVVTAGQQVALVAHFTGILLGLFAGRRHVLRRRSGRAVADPV